MFRSCYSSYLSFWGLPDRFCERELAITASHVIIFSTDMILSMVRLVYVSDPNYITMSYPLQERTLPLRNGGLYIYKLDCRTAPRKIVVGVVARTKSTSRPQHRIGPSESMADLLV